MISSHKINSLFHSESVIQKYQHGVRLLNPNEKNIRTNNKLIDPSIYSINELFTLPFNFYFNADNCIQNINEITAETCGFTSAQSAIGKSLAVVAKSETAAFVYQHDQDVIRSKQMVIKEEHYQRLDDVDFSIIAIKVPWYAEDNKIMGIFGCSIITNDQNCSLTYALTFILQTGLFNISANPFTKQTKALGREVLGTYLSARQIQCAQLLTRGKTAKEIAKILGLSPRTVEHYLEIIKSKLKVTSKSELIEKIILEKLV